MNGKINRKSKADLIARTLSQPVVLVGMMGSGKSSIGQGLAELLGLEFFDSDRLIEKKAGQSIPEIFSEQGEAVFRGLEKDSIAALFERPPCVIATGGGAVMDPQSLHFIKQRAISVWLQASVEEILERLKESGDRPLLQGEDRKARLESLMQQRQPYYEQADLTVRTIQNSLEDTLEALINTLYAHLNPDNV